MWLKIYFQYFFVIIIKFDKKSHPSKATTVSLLQDNDGKRRKRERKGKRRFVCIGQWRYYHNFCSVIHPIFLNRINFDLFSSSFRSVDFSSVLMSNINKISFHSPFFSSRTLKLCGYFCFANPILFMTPTWKSFIKKKENHIHKFIFCAHRSDCPIHCCLFQWVFRNGNSKDSRLMIRWKWFRIAYNRSIRFAGNDFDYRWTWIYSIGKKSAKVTMTIFSVLLLRRMNFLINGEITKSWTSC